MKSLNRKYIDNFIEKYFFDKSDKILLADMGEYTPIFMHKAGDENNAY